MTRRNWLIITSCILISSLVFSACGQEAAGEQVTDQITQSPEPTSIQPSETLTPIPTGIIIDILAGDQEVTIFGADPINLGTQVGDQFGVTLAAGDFNGDGIVDVLIGANGADGPGNERDHAGDAYVIFGQPDLPEVIDADITSESTWPDIYIYGAEVGIPSDIGFGIGDNMTEVITTGDIDGDGFDDIILGATLADGPQNSLPDTGEVYIIFGRNNEDWDALKSGPTGQIVFDIKGVYGFPADVMLHGADAMDLFSCGLTAGDLDKDGDDELIIGACYADGLENSKPDAGEVYLFFGKPQEAWKDLVIGDYISASLADIIFYGADSGDSFGSAVSSSKSRGENGDVNNDGYIDLLLGARNADGVGNDKPDAGEVHVFFGRPASEWEIFSSIDLAAVNADVAIYGVDPGDSLSLFLGLYLGDVNGDKIGDILISAPFSGGFQNTDIMVGEVYILFGRETWDAVMDLTLSPADVEIYGAEAYDRFGILTICRDLGSDGISDLLIGAPGGDGPQNARVDGAGEVYVIFGRDFQSGSQIQTADTSSYQLIIYAEETYDDLGHAGVIGDVNDDGINDIVIGAFWAYGPNNARPEAGEVYVIIGRSW